MRCARPRERGSDRGDRRQIGEGKCQSLSASSHPLVSYSPSHLAAPSSPFNIALCDSTVLSPNRKPSPSRKPSLKRRPSLIRKPSLIRMPSPRSWPEGKKDGPSPQVPPSPNRMESQSRKPLDISDELGVCVPSLSTTASPSRKPLA